MDLSFLALRLQILTRCFPGFSARSTSARRNRITGFLDDKNQGREERPADKKLLQVSRKNRRQRAAGGDDRVEFTGMSW